MKLFKRKTQQKLVSERIAPISFDDLPKEISLKLKQSVARVRRIIIFRGSLAVVAALFISILSIIAIDAMIPNLSSLVRWGLWLAGVVAIALTSYISLVKPLSVPFTPRRIAALIERNHPELEERLSTVVELIGSPEMLNEGSKRLMEVITDTAINDIKNVSPRKEFTTKTVKPKFIIAISSFAILFLLFIAFPRHMGRLVTRAIIPSAEVSNVYADNLEVMPGDTVVLKGTSLNVQLAVTGGFPGIANILTKSASSRKESKERFHKATGELQGKESAKFYTHTYTSVEESFKYRITCGSAETRSYKVDVVPIPAYKEMTITCEYPSYTGKGFVKLDNGALDINAIEGTKVNIDVVPERELMGHIHLLPTDTNLSPKSDMDDDISFSFVVKPENAGQWGLVLSDKYGFSNEVQYASINVVKDMEPEITITDPEFISCKLPTFGTLPFSFEVTEDFGISDPMIYVSMDGGDYKEYRAITNYRETENGLFRGNDVLSLVALPLKGVYSMRFKLVVKDNYPESMGGPHVAESQVITIQLQEDATTLMGQMLSVQKEKLDLTMDEVRKNISEAKKAAEQADGMLAPSPEDHTKAIEVINKSKQNIVKAENLLQELISGVRSSTLEPISLDISILLDDCVSPAHEQVDEALLAEDVSRRDEVKTLIDILSGSLDAFEKMKSSLDEFMEKLEELQKLKEMAEQEAMLAELAESGELSLEDWAEKQQELLNQFDEEFLDQINDPFKEQKEKLDQMGQSVDDLKSQQENIENLAEKLQDDSTRAEAEKELKEQTSSMPETATNEERLAKLENDLANSMNELMNNISEMSDTANGDKMDNSSHDPTEALTDASSFAEMAKEKMQDASDAFAEGEFDSAKENTDGAKSDLAKIEEALNSAKDSYDKLSLDAMNEQGQNTDLYEMREGMQEALDAAMEQMQGEQKRAEGEQDPNALQDPNAQHDPNAPQDPNAKQDPNAPQDPNAKQEQNAQQDPNAPQDPNAKTDPNAPQDPNAQQQQQQMQDLAQKAKDAAQKMQQQVQQMAQDMNIPQENMNTPPNMSQESDSKNESSNHTPQPEKKGVPGFLAEMGVTDADWFKMKSDVSSGATSDSFENVPAEYRDLVRAYFIELSKEAK